MLINGNTLENAPTVGRLHDGHPAVGKQTEGAFSDGRQGAIWFIAEMANDLSGADTYFEIILNLAVGRLAKLSVYGVEAAAPDHTITLITAQGDEITLTVDSGDTDNALTSAIANIVGPLTMRIDGEDIGGQRIRYALHFTDNITVTGADPPTGTGFRHVTDGVEDAAAQTVGTADIDDDAVTYAKMQNVSATDKVLGRSTAGTGNVEEIACTAAGRAILDDADAPAQLTTLGVDPFSCNLRDGVLAQTFDRASGQITLVPTSGTIYLMAVYLRKGQSITSLALCLSNAATTPANWWYVLCDASRNVVAVTADQTTTGTGTGLVSLNLASGPYVVPTSGMYYVGFMFNCGTAPTVTRSNTAAAGATNLNAVTPILCGTSNTAQTTPPAVAATLNAITAAQSMAWMRAA